MLKARAEASLQKAPGNKTEAVLDLPPGVSVLIISKLQMQPRFFRHPVRTTSLVVLVAAYLDDIRLIDNLPLN
jgi:pantothenate synthetase